MLMLLFSVGDNSYAVDTEHVVEILPHVYLKKMAHSPEYIAGLLNFEGKPTSVVDFCYLIEGRPCEDYFHTRIILFEFRFAGKTGYRMGVLAERVTQTVEAEKVEFIDTGVEVEGTPYLGGILNEKSRTIQLLLPEKLFQFMQASLFKEHARIGRGRVVVE